MMISPLWQLLLLLLLVSVFAVFGVALVDDGFCAWGIPWSGRGCWSGR